MIIGTTTIIVPKWIRAAAVCAAGVFAALFLAVGSSSIQVNLGIRTPGTLVSGALVRQSPGDWLGDQLQAQIIVDWIFWFAVMCGIYFLVAKLIGRSKIARNAKMLESARRLASLGGTMPEFKNIPRRKAGRN
ncbi:MAG: hypothetical protein WB683_20560 [Candidatus Sulfotelmatobacter sp.]